MNKSGIINSEICKAISAIGHTQLLVIADAGLPIPETVRNVIDLSFTKGSPDFISVVAAVLNELVVESCVYAEEIESKNIDIHLKLLAELKGLSAESVDHEKFKKMVENAFVVIKTGECSPYANIIFVAGVDF